MRFDAELRVRDAACTLRDDGLHASVRVELNNELEGVLEHGGC